jgi:biopolymer transport protein TolR
MGLQLPPMGSDGNDDCTPMAEINVTPFVDVMLVLLIIFMVTAPLMLAGVQIDIPETSAARQNPQQKPLVVSMSADGGIYIRDASVSRADLITSLADTLKSEGDSVAYIRADKMIPYGQVMDILGEISAAGYSQISLLSEKEPGS